MWWELIRTFFGAIGVLSALWAGLGWWLSGSKPVTLVLVCPDHRLESALLRLRWLDQLGVLRCRIIVAGARSLPPLEHQHTEFCTLAELSARIEAERERFD